MNLASCQFCRIVDSAIKLHFVSFITVSPSVKEGTSLWNGIIIIMTVECNLYVTYSALLRVSDNIIKIMPVHKNHEFLAVRMCELWVPFLQVSCLSMSFQNHAIAIYILWVQPIQFSIHLLMTSIESIWGSLRLGALLLLEGRYFERVISLLQWLNCSAF